MRQRGERGFSPKHHGTVRHACQASHKAKQSAFKQQTVATKGLMIRQKTDYDLPNVILPLIISGLFFMSDIAAIGRPQLATGPQKCYITRGNVNKQMHL